MERANKDVEGGGVADVFVSYKSEDREAAERLVRALNEDEVCPWWDQHIPADASWEVTIEQELSKAKAVIVCWSKASISSDNVKAEARRARQEGRLLQVFLDDCDPPLFFGERQGVNLTGWDGNRSHRGYQALLEGVRALLAGKKASAAVGYAPRRTAFLPLVIVATLTAAIVVAATLYFRREAPVATVAAPSETQETSASPRDTLERIFNGSEPPMLGANVRFLETILGPPTSSHRDAYGYAVNHYAVGDCLISATMASGNEHFGSMDESTVIMLSILTWSSDCSFDLSSYGAGLTSMSNIGQIAAAVSPNVFQMTFTADCANCPMGLYPDPSAYLVAQAPRVSGSWTLQVRFSGSSGNTFYNANENWLEALRQRYGRDYVDRNEFVCSPAPEGNLDDVALQVFRDLTPSQVSIGIRLPGPGPFGVPYSPCAGEGAERDW